MTRTELLRVAKPILFNTDMVRAILDEKKTVTRRIVKKEKADAVLGSPTRRGNPNIPDKDFIKYLVNAPCMKGNILYVRETFRPLSSHPKLGVEYAADWSPEYFENSRDPKACNGGKWKPSLHMPKEAARIFLKVTNVRVERLQDMDTMDAVKEGIDTRCCVNLAHALIKFKKLWNSTIKKKDLDLYGWNANPWVWVIEFERIYPDDYLESRTVK